ncbi:hypothetical protein HanIR_Chr12g0577801 [Helianthus annuus]|nr:hypothetical protein HanIR_Chr12g0577801 [Helianthus annuus]KAJ0504898.1 hypothetical protein HanHA89_Chr12g0464411 [Helianthus annuus]
MKVKHQDDNVEAEIHHVKKEEVKVFTILHLLLFFLYSHVFCFAKNEIKVILL